MNAPSKRTGNQCRTIAKAAFVLSACFAAGIVLALPARADIANTATASGTYNGNTVQSLPSSVSVQVDAGVPALEVTKTGTPDTNLQAGQTVTYTYVVRNSGNQTLTNVTLSDAHNGAGTPPVPGNEALTSDVSTQNDSTDATANDGVWSVLAPGDSITMTATYIVKQADVDSKQ